MSDASASGDRFAKLTVDDHSGLIYIAAYLVLTYSLLTVVTRCFIKWRMFGFDDLAMCVAQAVTIAQFAFLLSSATAGLGKSFTLLTNTEYSRMASALYTNQVLVYISVGISKCSAFLLIYRVFSRDKKDFYILSSVIFMIMFIWTIAAPLLVSVGCTPGSTAFTGPGTACSDMLGRYQVVTITDVITDVILMGLPAHLVWQLQMGKSVKLQVIAVFGCRLPLLFFSVLAFTRYKTAMRSVAPGVDRTAAILYQQTEVCFSLIAGTIPCLKSFIQSFDTGSGVKGIFTLYGSSGQGASHGSQTESYRMQNLSGRGRKSIDKGDIRVVTRPFPREESSRAAVGGSKGLFTSHVHAGEEEESLRSHESQEMIIRRDVRWEVTREHE